MEIMTLLDLFLDTVSIKKKTFSIDDDVFDLFMQYYCIFQLDGPYKSKMAVKFNNFSQ